MWGLRVARPEAVAVCFGPVVRFDNITKWENPSLVDSRLVRGCIVTESDGPNADLNTTCQLHPTSTSSRMFRVSPEEHCVFVRNSAGRCPTFPKLTRVCTNSSCSPYPEDSIFPDVSEMNRNSQKFCMCAVSRKFDNSRHFPTYTCPKLTGFFAVRK